MSRRTTNLAFWLVLSLTATIAAAGALSYWRGFSAGYGTGTRAISGGTYFGYVMIVYGCNIPAGPFATRGFFAEVYNNPKTPWFINSPLPGGWVSRVLALQRSSTPGGQEADWLYIHFSLLIVPLALWAYLLRRRYKRLKRGHGAFPVGATTKENPIN